MLIRPVYRPRMPSLAFGLVGWWPFDDAANAIDYSGKRNNGVPTSVIPCGGRALGLRGIRGALKFNGSSSIVSSFPSEISPSRPRTLAAWINTSLSSRQGIMGTRDNNSNGMSLIVNRTTAGNLTYTVTGSVNVQIAAGITTNSWFHVAATDNGSTGVLYVNGNSIGSSGSGTETVAVGTGVIGDEGTVGGGGNFFSGFIDDVRIYNRALSPAEVLALYAEAFQPQIDIETIALMQKSQQSFLAAWAMQRNQISQGWAS